MSENESQNENPSQESAEQTVVNSPPNEDLLAFQKEELKRRRNRRLINQGIVVLVLILAVSEGNPVNNFVDSTPIGGVIDNVKNRLGITEDTETVAEETPAKVEVVSTPTTLGEVEEIVVENENVEELDVDEEAPVWPNPSIIFSDITQTSFTFTWEFATDNIGIEQYKILINSIGAGSVGSEGNTFSVNGTTASTEYKVEIIAVDKNGNSSGALTSTVTTADPEQETVEEEEEAPEENGDDNGTVGGIPETEIPSVEDLVDTPELGNVFVLPPDVFVVNPCLTDTTVPTYTSLPENVTKSIADENPVLLAFRVEDNCGLGFDYETESFSVQIGIAAGVPIYQIVNVNYLISAKFYMSGTADNGNEYEYILLDSRAIAYDDEEAKWMTGLVEYNPIIFGSFPGDFLIYAEFTDLFGNVYQDEIASLRVNP
jgi:chitodextrinase